MRSPVSRRDAGASGTSINRINLNKPKMGARVKLGIGGDCKYLRDNTYEKF